MVIKYHISPYPALTEDMVVKIYEAQAPEAEVYSQVLPAPHNAPVTIAAQGMDKVVHIVRLYAATSAVLLHEYSVEPTTDLATVFDPIRFKIGDGQQGTPAAGARDYVNPLLDGLQDNEFEVMRNNYGELFPVLHYTNRTGFGGGFSLLAPDEFNNEEEFVIRRSPKVNTVVSDSVVGKWFGGFVDITADMQYVPAHLRKLMRFKGAFNYTFPAGTAMPIGYAFCFQNMFGYVGRVTFLNAQLLSPLAAISYIEVPAFGFAAVVYDGTYWNVIYFGTAGGNNTEDTSVGKVMAIGEVNVGDVAPGDPIFTVNHGKNIQGDYTVMLSIRSNDPATHYKNNQVGYTWWHSPTNKPNAFLFSLQEIVGEQQNLSVSWVIVKL